MTLLTDLSYRIELDLTIGGDVARSRSEVRFRCTRPGATASADLNLANVTSIELNGAALPLGAWHDGRLDLPPLDADNLLVVEGDVPLTSGRDGLCTFVDTGGERFVYLHLPVSRPSSAADVMCCFVGVGRVPIELTVIAPGGWSVHSHASSTERPAPGEPGAWRFALPRPVELPTFVAGPWVANGDVLARPSMRATLAASPIGDTLDAVIAHHERVLGVAHPFTRPPCVLIPGYGSQGENSGGIVVCHERVLHGSVDESWRAYVLWVLAHEAAHSWFGATFERRAPEDGWLFEGIATYLCHRAMEALAPELAPWARFHVLEELEAQRVDAGPDAHPVAALPPSRSQPMAPLMYGKPAALLRQLERVVGRDAVDRALRSLIVDHDVAGTSDFVGAVERAAGADLAAWFDDWFRAAGVSTLSFDRGVIRQTGDRLRTHRIAVRAFDLVQGTLVARPPTDVVVFGASTHVGALDGADLVVLNAPATSYVRVRLDDASRASLAEHLGRLPFEVRATCWVAAIQMVEDGLMSRDELDALVAAHADAEPDPQVRALLSMA